MIQSSATLFSNSAVAIRIVVLLRPELHDIATFGVVQCRSFMARTLLGVIASDIPWKAPAS